jgi:hypothetical protein
MRFHIDRYEGFHPMLAFQFNAPASRNADFALRPPENPAPRPSASPPLRPESPLSQDPLIADEHPMITALYEAHLAKEKMLAAFAELRGDDPEGPWVNHTCGEFLTPP